MLTLLRTLAFASMLAAAPALAHTPAQPPHQSYKIGDLTLDHHIGGAGLPVGAVVRA